MHERKRAFSVVPKASPWRPNHVTICLLVILGSLCKMANSSSEDETDTSPERPTRIQPYQFELSGRILKEYWNIVSASKQTPCGIPWGLRNRTHWSARYTARKSARLNCINLIHFRLTTGRLRGSSCIVISGVVCELLQFAATQWAGIVNFFVDHTHTQFTEEFKMATALTPQTDVTSEEAYRK